MTMASPSTAPPPAASAAVANPALHWSAILAGALVATAIWLVLMAFGLAIGLSALSSSPTWRNASMPLALLSGVWNLVVAIGSFAIGGYVAGRMRRRLSVASSDEIEFRDGISGAAAWAVAVILGTVLMLAQAQLLAPAMAEREGGTASQARGGEPRYLSYEVDRLLRGSPDAATSQDVTPIRPEVSRLLAAALDERTFLPEDRTHLVGLVSGASGLEPEAAQRRVDGIISQTRERANRARRSLVITAFMAATSLIIGFAVAWFAAGVGGRHRDDDLAPTTRLGAAIR